MSLFNITQIVVKLNSQTKDISGVFLGLGNNGSLKLELAMNFLNIILSKVIFSKMKKHYDISN